MARNSAGVVNIVKPLELQRKMREIIDDPVVATDVKVHLSSLLLPLTLLDENRFARFTETCPLR